MIPMKLVHALNRNGVWKQFDAFRADRGKGLPNWPDWCWCPLAGAFAILTQGSDDRLPGQGKLAELGAVAAWRAGQGIYRIHPFLMDALRDTPVTGVPAQWLYMLPEWCMWFEVGQGGFFAHLEYDVNHNRPELRFWVVPSAEASGYPIILHLDKETIEECIESVFKESRRNAKEFLVEGGELPTVGEYEQVVRPFLNLLIYAIGAIQKGDIRNPKQAGLLPRKHTKTPNHPQVWEVGWKQGDAFKQAYEAMGQGEHSSPRPHVRRAHWHSFWQGSEAERTLSVRWLPPIMVGAGEIVPTVHEIKDD